MLLLLKRVRMVATGLTLPFVPLPLLRTDWPSLLPLPPGGCGLRYVALLVVTIAARADAVVAGDELGLLTGDAEDIRDTGE